MTALSDRLWDLVRAQRRGGGEECGNARTIANSKITERLALLGNIAVNIIEDNCFQHTILEEGTWTGP